MDNEFVLPDIDFEISDGLELEETRYKKIDRSINHRYTRLLASSVANFKQLVPHQIEPDTQYRLVTTSSFNALTVLSALLSDYKISEMVLAIYRMNIGAVEKIREFAIASRKPVYCLLSSFFRENHKYERWTEKLENAGKEIPNLHVGFAWSHAKVCLLKTECGKYIVFEGSGNLSDNARIEQYLLEDNEEIYNFHRDWIVTLVTGEEDGIRDE